MTKQKQKHKKLPAGAECCDFCKSKVQTSLYRGKHNICETCLKIIVTIMGNIDSTKEISLDWTPTGLPESHGNEFQYTLLITCPWCGGLMQVKHTSKWKVQGKLVRATKNTLRRRLLHLCCVKCGKSCDLCLLGYLNEYLYVNDIQVKAKDFYREERIREGKDLLTNLHDAQTAEIKLQHENAQLKAELAKLKGQPE